MCTNPQQVYTFKVTLKGLPKKTRRETDRQLASGPIVQWIVCRHWPDKNKPVPRTSGFFVNIGCKFFLADLGTTNQGSFEQTKRCGWIGTNQDQV